MFPLPSLIPNLSTPQEGKANVLSESDSVAQCFWYPDLQARVLASPVLIENLRKVLVDVMAVTSPPRVDKLIIFRLEKLRMGKPNN